MTSTLPSPVRTPHTIIVGTVYDVFHDQCETDGEFFARVDRDIALMKETGINHVMVFPMGQWDPDSRRHLWTRTDYIVRKIEESGLKFVPVMLKEEQCASYFPVWKFREIDGLWNEHALDNGGRNNRDNVDFADPRISPVLAVYFREVIERYGKSPALSFYNIWNEPHYGSTGAHVIDRFRIWLRGKYGSLPALRRAWGEEYASWDEVSPFLAENWVSSMPGIDWTMFRSELNGILLEELIRSLREHDREHPVNANPVGTPWAGFSNFGGYDVDSWPIAARDDIHGISYYPDIWERDHDLAPCPFWLHTLTFNIIRCSSPGGEFILTELYTHAQNGLALNGYLTKDSVRLLAWTALASGCKGMIYWQWLPFMRGRQALGRGLCRINGELAPRGEAVKELGLLAGRYGELLYRGRLRKARAAILVDMAGLVKSLEQTTESATTRFMYESNAGLFKSLYEGNISVDMLRMDRGIDLESLKTYRIVYLPFQIVMRRPMAGILREYVRQGGWVVADARCAMLDEQDVAYRTSPGAGLDELFGAERVDVYGERRFFRVILNEAAGRAPREFEGKYFRDELHVSPGADVIGRFADDGAPAVIRRGYGSGKAILSAVPLGASYHGRPENQVKGLLLELARDAGVTPEAEFVSPQAGFVSVRVHDAGDDLILYLINPESGVMSGTLEAVIGDRRIRGVSEILTGADVPFEERNGTLAVPLTMKERGVTVFHVKFGR